MAALTSGRLFCVGVAAIGLLLFVTTIGTPYFQMGPTVCRLDRSGRLPCVPPTDCTYFGVQGRRWLHFNDAIRCPVIALLPWAIGNR